MKSAFGTWFVFRRQALRSWLIRWRLMRRGAYVGEGARIPGGGELDLAPSSMVQRLSVLNVHPTGVIRIDRGSRIGAFAVLSAVRSIEIGADVLIADRVFISDHHHEWSDPDRPVLAQGHTPPRPVSIGDGCWLGINVCVMPGVVLGTGCIVGAGSVVTRSFEAGSVIGGSPAVLLRSRRTHAA